MTIRTRIEVDVTGLSAQIDTIKNKLGEITTAARGGEYKLNTQQAERDVGHLLRQLDKLEVLQGHAARNDELLPDHAQDMARVYRQAANAVNRVNRQSGTDEPVDWLRTAADEQAQAAAATEQDNSIRQRRQSQYELLSDGADQLFSPVPPTVNKLDDSSSHFGTRDNVEGDTVLPVDEQLNLSRERVSRVQNIIGGDNFRRMDAGGISRLDNKQAQRGIDELAAQYDVLEKAIKRQGDISIDQAKRLAAIYRDIAKNIDAINQRHGLTQTAAEPIRKAATEAQAEANRLALNPLPGQAQLPNQHGNNPQLNLLARGAGVIAGAAIGGGGAGSAIGSLLGGLLPGPYGLVGSAVGGTIGGQIDKGLSGAETEAISYHDLRNQLGNAAVDFDVLRDGVRKLTEGLGVGYNESVKLAQQFTRTAAATPDAAKLGRDLQDAIGFGRSYGVEPSAAVDFFAQQRLAGVTTGEADNKRLAVQIAEAVGRGGGNAKMTEMLSVISNFTQKTAYESLITPDVSAFTSLIGTLVNSGTPGLAGNPANAANLLGQANAGFAGSGGDAQNMFMMLALQSANPNFTGFELPVARSAGLLASPAQYLGPDSQQYQLAESYQDWQTLGRYNKLNQSTDKNLTMIIKAGERNSTRSDGSVNTNMLSGYVQQQTKLDINQADALILSYQQNKGFGSLETKLKDFNLDEKTLGTQKLGAIAPLLLSQNSGAYIEQYQQLQANDKVPKKDQERIAAIKDTGSKEFKQEVLKLVMDNATDEGDKLLKVNADMADNLQKLATELIPATLVIKQGILEVVRWVAKIPDNENAKTFVANEDLKAMGGRYGIEISGKNGNDKPLIDKDAALQKFLNFEKNYAQDKPGWKDDAYKMLHNAGEDFNQLQADYQAHQSAFPKETPQLLANMRKHAGLDHSVPTEHNDQYYALPLTGLNAAGDSVRDNSKSDNIIQRLLPRQYKGRPFIAPQDLRKYKEEYANNKTEYDTAVGGFLDRLTPLVEKAPVDEKTGYRLVDQEAVYGLLEKKPQAEDFRQPIAPPAPPPVYAPSESQPSRLPASGKGLSDPPTPGRSLSDAQLSEAFNHPHTIVDPSAWLGRADTLPEGADISASRGYRRLKPNQRRVADKIVAESARQGHPELANFITATALSESSLNQSATAQSKHGEAKGIFQFIPGTAKKRNVNPRDEDDNIRGGVELFIENRQKFNSIDKAIAAHLTGLDYTKTELKAGGPQDPLDTNGMEKAAAVERLALAFTPDEQQGEVLPPSINVARVPEAHEAENGRAGEYRRRRQPYPEKYPGQTEAGKGLDVVIEPYASINARTQPNDEPIRPIEDGDKRIPVSDKAMPAPYKLPAPLAEPETLYPFNNGKVMKNPSALLSINKTVSAPQTIAMPAPSINVAGAPDMPEKTGNDSGMILHTYHEKPPLATGIIIPWTANTLYTHGGIKGTSKAGKDAPKINTGKTMSNKAAPIITGKPDKPTVNMPLSWAMDNKIKNQDKPDKIPDNLFAAAQKEAEKTMRFRFNPLAVNIALTDRLGNPMTDNIISSNFGLPRPSGTS